MIKATSKYEEKILKNFFTPVFIVFLQISTVVYKWSIPRMSLIFIRISSIRTVCVLCKAPGLCNIGGITVQQRLETPKENAYKLEESFPI